MNIWQRKWHFWNMQGINNEHFLCDSFRVQSYILKGKNMVFYIYKQMICDDESYRIYFNKFSVQKLGNAVLMKNVTLLALNSKLTWHMAHIIYSTLVLFSGGK